MVRVDQGAAGVEEDGTEGPALRRVGRAQKNTGSRKLPYTDSSACRISKSVQ